MCNCECTIQQYFKNLHELQVDEVCRQWKNSAIDPDPAGTGTFGLIGPENSRSGTGSETGTDDRPF